MEKSCVSSAINTADELEFAIFCIENIAEKLNVDAADVHKALTEQSNVLNGYIVPCYDILHSQGKDYIVADIISYMKREGVMV